MPRTVPVTKICPICNQEFLSCPPGKTSTFYARANSVYCSNLCASKSRYKSGTEIKTLSEAEAAYIAGFLDGEGAVMLYKKRDGVAMRIVFTNSNLKVLNWICDKTELKNKFAKRQGKKNHKPGYFLYVNADLAVSLLKQLRPYLKIKHKQADLAIEFQNRINQKSDPDKSWQQDYMDQMQAMNQRGNRDGS